VTNPRVLRTRREVIYIHIREEEFVSIEEEDVEHFSVTASVLPASAPLH
jgi:hypothetical protein